MKKMKIFILKNQYCEFGVNGIGLIKGMSFEPTTERERDKLFCKTLAKQFKDIHGSSFDTIGMSLYLIHDEQDKLNISIKLRDPSGVLDMIKNKILVDADAQLDVEVIIRGTSSSNIIDTEKPIFFATKEMPIKDNTVFPCEDDKVTAGVVITGQLRDEPHNWFYGTITIRLSFSKNHFTCQIYDTVRQTINKRILDDGICYDAAIVPKNGNPVKCHKIFLMAHSSVFADMFNIDMEEMASSALEMPEMTEEAVHALLAYLYHEDVTKPSSKSAIALELLNAGVKYNIPPLEASMASVLLKKPDYMNDVNLAVRLFLLARDLPDADQLKMESIEVMKANLTALQESTTYCDLFKNKPDLAMELFQFAIGALN